MVVNATCLLRMEDATSSLGSQFANFHLLLKEYVKMKTIALPNQLKNRKKERKRR